jgi:hypothetical protein
VSRRADRAQRHRPHPVTRAEFARRCGRARSSITEACSVSLAAACLAGGRLDAAHPEAVAWAAARGIGAAQLLRDAPSDRSPPLPLPDLLLVETAVTFAEAAKIAGVTVEQFADDVREDPTLKAAIVPVAHVCINEFATRAGTSTAEVLDAIRGALRAAVTASGRLDLAHRSALEFMAARPLKRKRNGDPIMPEVNGRGYLSAACVGDDIDLDHPVYRVFDARLHGRLRTDAERYGIGGAA